MNPSFNLVGVLGAGSFGTAVANLLAYNVDVLLFSRKQETVDSINRNHTHLGVAVSPRVTATSDLAELARHCTLILPIVPSNSFRSMFKALAPHLRPHHIIIHGTKGFDLNGYEESDLDRPGLVLGCAAGTSLRQV